MKSCSAAVVPVLVLLLAGCASVGRQFNYHNREQLVLGMTSKAEAISLLGKPYKTATGTSGDVNFEVFRYTYAHGTLSGATSRVTILEFSEDKLNAFIHASGFEEDKTDFDETGIELVTKGTSTRDQVEAVLGKPSGRARCPSCLDDFSYACTGCVEVWRWVYVSKSKGLDASSAKTKSVTVGFDDNGVVSQVASVSTQ